MIKTLGKIIYTPDPINSWSDPLSLLVKEAYESALEGKNTLADHWKTMAGMSGKKYRGFINNLIKLVPNPRYLEIGSWRGSTACSAIYGNKLKAVCIDNWSQFGGPKAEFQNNVDRCLKDSNCDFSFIEQDFRTVDYNSLGKFNVYFYDGPHEEQDQYDAIKLVQNCLDDQYILIIDDVNADWVRSGTLNAINDLNSKVVSSIEIITDYPGPREQNSDWHNGYFISVIKK